MVQMTYGEDLKPLPARLRPSSDLFLLLLVVALFFLSFFSSLTFRSLVVFFKSLIFIYLSLSSPLFTTPLLLLFPTAISTAVSPTLSLQEKGGKQHERSRKEREETEEWKGGISPFKKHTN